MTATTATAPITNKCWIHVHIYGNITTTNDRRAK